LAKLLLVRHGQTTGNSAERFWGRTDVALSEIGLRQAEQLRDRLANEKIDAVYASSLGRALQTAEIIAAGRELDVILCPELWEIDFGLVEGLTFAEISQQFPGIAGDWFHPDLGLRFPGGESFTELNSRVAGFIPRLAGHAQEETVLIVAHSGVLRLLLCNVLGLEAEHWRQFRLDLASLSILNTYNETAILNLWNDVSHLA
jgi:alpha-ribazole phosphatase